MNFIRKSEAKIGFINIVEEFQDRANRKSQSAQRAAFPRRPRPRQPRMNVAASARLNGTVT
jgi:hypothetical protein